MNYQMLSFTLATQVLVVVCACIILRAIHHGVRKIMAKLDELSANVASTVSAEKSAIVLLGNLKSALDSAILADDDGDALQALSDSLATNQAALAAAVVANTPASATGHAAADGATSTAHPANAPPVPDPVPAPTPPVTIS